MTYLSNDNKGMLWGLLQESTIFTGIPDDKFEHIKQIFDTTMYEINKNKSVNSLMEKNKNTVEELMIKINNLKKKFTNNTYNPNNSSKLKVVYKAEDIKKEKNNEFNLKLEEQRNNMSSLINPKKPSDINFADSTNDDDKPIGSDMDRLISERLASRERELEIPTLTQEGEKWLNSTNATNNINTIDKKPILKEESKHVTFDSQISEEISPTKTDVEKLFNKIKRKPNTQINTNAQINTNVQVKDEINFLIEKQILLIKENIEIKDRLKILLDKI